MTNLGIFRAEISWKKTRKRDVFQTKISGKVVLSDAE